MRAHRLLFYLSKLYHSADWRYKSSCQAGARFLLRFPGSRQPMTCPGMGNAFLKEFSGGYTGDVVGEAVPAGFFRFLIPGCRQNPGPGAVDEICEIRTENFRSAIGRFAYDTPMNCGSRQEVSE